MPRSRSRAAVVAVAVAMLLATLVALTDAAPASGASINPQYNIRISGKYSNVTWYFRHTSCERAPAGSTCENAVVKALDHARAALGKPNYDLPARFDSLTAAEQLLVLVNDDRHVYGRAAVRGLNAALDKGAVAGAKKNLDPSQVGTGWVAVASNWAGGMRSALFAYYGWMYDDGLDPDGTSKNIDCSTSHPSGCWSHRNNMLFNFGSGNQIALGIGHATTGSGPSWTQLFQAYPASKRLAYVPTVTGLSVHSGPAAGGTTVTITGFGLVRVGSVHFGATAAKITHRSATALRVRAPKHAKGTVHVVVTAVGGHSSSTGAAAYAYR